MRRIAAWMLVIAVLRTAPAGAAESFTFSGSCTSGDVVVAADAEAVRTHIPASGYSLIEAGGQTPLLIGVGRCENTILNGTPIGTYRYSEAVVFVHLPDGAVALYTIWQTPDNRFLRSAWDSLGVYGGFLSGGSFDARMGPISGIMNVDVPWSVAPHTVQIKSSGPQLPVEQSDGAPCDATAPGAGRHRGSRGDVGIAFKISQPLEPVGSYASRGGLGVVTAPPGSVLAQLMGAARATGAAAIRRFDYVGCAALLT